jgi:hypothetical protein
MRERFASTQPYQSVPRAVTRWTQGVSGSALRRAARSPRKGRLHPLVSGRLQTRRTFRAWRNGFSRCEQIKTGPDPYRDIHNSEPTAWLERCPNTERWVCPPAVLSINSWRRKSRRKMLAGICSKGVTSADPVQSNGYRYFCGLTLPATGRYHSDICKCQLARGGRR